MDKGAWRATVHGGYKESDRTKWLNTCTRVRAHTHARVRTRTHTHTHTHTHIYTALYDTYDIKGVE